MTNFYAACCMWYMQTELTSFICVRWNNWSMICVYWMIHNQLPTVQCEKKTTVDILGGATVSAGLFPLYDYKLSK